MILFKNRILPILFTAALLLGAALQALFGLGAFWTGWLAGSALLLLTGTALYAAWRLARGGKALAWMVFLAFALRLAFGVGMAQLLPVAGYPEKEQQAGYTSKDAYNRDLQAWDLAQSGRPLTAAFGADYSADQYGGLIALIATVYRVFSPDAHRPFLVIVVTAAAAALGIPFFWAAVRRRWGERIAAAGGWILALYPESIFWGGSQMREPILIGLTAVAFWGLLRLRSDRQLGAAGLVVGLAGLFAFSSPVAGAVLGVLVVWGWLEYMPENSKPVWQILGWAGVAAGLLGLIGMSWGWLRSSSSLDVYMTVRASGQIQWLLDNLLGGRALLALVTAYGLARPVLPAAMFDPAPVLVQATWIVRAVGWYALAPVMIYGSLSALGVREPKERRIWIWLAGLVWVWALVASARAGGDASDNPRYRVIFLVWMALLAAWAWDWASQRQYRWLARLGVIEGVFLAVFIHWYAARHFHFYQYSFVQMFSLIGLVSAAIVILGWYVDRKANRAPVAPGYEIPATEGGGEIRKNNHR